MSSRSHLLNDRTAERYRRSLTHGVERVAARLARTEQPFTGVTPAELAPTVSAVDLEKPLGTASEALEELERVYLRDAVYFHHPRYLAHLNSTAPWSSRPCSAKPCSPPSTPPWTPGTRARAAP